MAEFRSFDPQAEVAGRAMLSIIDGIGEQAQPFLAKQGLSTIDPEAWYSQQLFLDIFKDIAQAPRTTVFDMVSIGMKIPERSIFPPHVTSTETALLSLDAAYQKNNRGGNIGHYAVTRISDTQIDVIAENPFPCDMVYGVIYGLIQRFPPPGINYTVVHDATQPCRKTGAMSCTYHVSWNPKVSYPVIPSLAATEAKPTGAAPAPTGTTAEIDAVPSFENLYKFGLTDASQGYLSAQAHLFKQYIRDTARRYLPNQPMNDILDLGCGEGQITRTWYQLYPDARIVGADRDATAIAKATQTQSQTPHTKLNPIHYVVADIENGLPGGAFDLIHASLTLMYLSDVEKALQAIFSALRPGGYVWLREYPVSLMTTISENAHYTRYWALAAAAMGRVGMRMFLGSELTQMLEQSGFTNVQRSDEKHLIGDNSLAGELTKGVILGTLYSFRKVIAKMQQIPEGELIKMHQTLCSQANTFKGQWTLANVIARRPLKS